MAVRVKEGKVRHDYKTYIIGDIMTGLSDDDESRLISLGVAEHIGEIEEKYAPAGIAPVDEDPKTDVSPDESPSASENDESINLDFNVDEYVDAGNKKGKDGK
jgi:hypothetical protein